MREHGCSIALGKRGTKPPKTSEVGRGVMGWGGKGRTGGGGRRGVGMWGIKEAVRTGWKGREGGVDLYRLKKSVFLVKM